MSSKQEEYLKLAENAGDFHALRNMWAILALMEELKKTNEILQRMETRMT